MGDDFRIIELFKENSPSAFEIADKAAKKSLKDCSNNMPRGYLENFMFWTMVNWYSYQVMQEVVKEIEKDKT